MRHYCNIHANPCTLVTGLGNDIEVTSIEKKRRDADVSELGLFQGVQSSAAPVKLSDSYEIVFLARYPNDWNGDAVVLCKLFDWKPAEQVYAGKPSYNTQQLRALFCGARGGYRFGAAHTIDLQDQNRFITIDNAGGVNVTAPTPGAFAAQAKVWVIAATGAVTLVAGAGAVISNPDALSLTVAAGSMVQLEKVDGTTWKLSLPGNGELAKVELIGEYSWRELSSPLDWTSVKTFSIVVANDVIRGDEGAPVDAGAVDGYVKWVELDAALVRADIVQALDDEAKDRARQNIGALGAGVAVSYTDQDPTDEQQGIARDNIGAASQADLDALASDVDAIDAEVAALTTTVGGKASSSSVTALAATVGSKADSSAVTAVSAALSALDALVLKKTSQPGFSDSEKAIMRANIGAAAGGTGTTRLAARFNAVPGSVTPSLDGALHVVEGTATARPVAVTFPGFTFTVPVLSNDTLSCAGHPFSTNTPVMVESTGALAAPLLPWTWYYCRDVTGSAFKLAATVGGAAIDITSSGSGVQKIARASSTIFPQMRRIGFVSAATAGKSCGTRHNSLAWAVSSNVACGRWTYTARFGVSDAAAVAQARLFVGLINTVAVIGNVNPSTLFSLVGIGADSGDVNLQMIHNDASGSATKVDLGSGFPANTLSADMYEIQLVCANDGASVAYTVKNLCTGNTTTGTLSSNLPANNVLLAPQAWRNNGSTALAVGLDVPQWTIETAY